MDCREQEIVINKVLCEIRYRKYIEIKNIEKIKKGYKGGIKGV